MSWNVSIQKSVSKADAPAAIDALDFSENDVTGRSEAVVTSMRAQLVVAKVAAKAILDVHAGPNVQVSLWGHANGTGEAPAPAGWAGDNVGCSVSQVEAPQVLKEAA